MTREPTFSMKRANELQNALRQEMNRAELTPDMIDAACGWEKGTSKQILEAPEIRDVFYRVFEMAAVIGIPFVQLVETTDGNVESGGRSFKNYTQPERISLQAKLIAEKLGSEPSEDE